MDSRKIVFQETGIVALGQAVCVALMLGVYGLLGFFGVKVLLGALVGAAIAIANFFFMAVVVSMAADRAQEQDVEGGQKMLKGAYPVRLIVLAVILVACGKSGLFDLVALVLPLLFVRPVLMVAGFFRKKEGM